MSQAPIGVLLMSLGSPENLDQMRDYLTDIRHGRKPGNALVEELKARYRAAGGRSPLLDITNRQAQALQKSLDPTHARVRVYVGMRHWHPRIEAVMKQMADDGIQRMISLPMTPYDSKLALEAYHAAVRKANETLPRKLEIGFAKSWHDHPGLLESFTEVVEAALTRLKQRAAPEPRVLFTAHSLPLHILKENDPYPNQLLQTAALVAKQAGLSVWSFAYQSQGAGAEPWLGPQVPETLDYFYRRRVKCVLIAPIGFVSDHMEILYDIDIHFKNLAQERGIELERTASLNDSPTFIRALTEVAEESLKKFAPVPEPNASHLPLSGAILNPAT